MFFRYFVFFMMAMLCWLGMVSGVEVENTLDEYLIWASLQIVFHDNLVLGVLVAAGWGFFSALVAMTCTHDARYTHWLLHFPHFILSSLLTSSCLLSITAILPSLTSHGYGGQLVVYMISITEPPSTHGLIRWVCPCSLFVALKLYHLPRCP